MRDEFGRFIKGHSVPEEWREVNRKGWKHTFEAKAKISEAQMGNKNHEWKGGTETYHRKIARKVVGIYGKTGYKRIKQDGQNLVVHHIDGNIKNNYPNNLVVMTRSEHTKLHWKQNDITSR